MAEGEQDYDRGPGIPPRRGGFLGDRSFGDRPFPAPGREHFREQWNAREVHFDTVHLYFKSSILGDGLMSDKINLFQ